MALLILCLLYLVLTAPSNVNGIVVKPSSNCHGDVCYFDWEIGYTHTMVLINKEDTYGQPIVSHHGSFYRRDYNESCNTYVPLTKSEFDKVNTADGNYRLAYAINGQLPGPPIIVYEDQTVVVTVRNKLRHEGVSIHWHGMFQRGTPWMDGSTMVSQCPISPGQTFQYRFIASPSGTHWYHAHTGTLRTDGVAGALIVLERPEQPTPSLLSKVPCQQDYYGVIQDWSSKPSLQQLQSLNWKTNQLPYGFNINKCRKPTLNPDGTTGVLFKFNAVLVNGKGRRYPYRHLIAPENPLVPLETYIVKPSHRYRFRFVNIGAALPFKISIDMHQIVLVAFDGNEINPVKVDGVVISPGESVDFMLYAGQLVDNYWINFETTESKDSDGNPILFPSRGHAILHYDGAPTNRDPLPRQRICSAMKPCYVVNQVYGVDPVYRSTINIPISKLSASDYALYKIPVPQPSPVCPFQEEFLNFNFHDGPSINGKKYVPPTSPLQTLPGSDAITPCFSGECEETCKCTHIIHLGLGNVVQLVFSILDTDNVRRAHPVHFHGHHFHVVKTVYPKYDPVTGEITEITRDLTCTDKRCNRVRWTNPSWSHGNIPGLNLKNPPLKDTVIVPYGGYVIVRFKADNPGFWFLHCHLEIHQSRGMKLILHEGSTEDMNPPPLHFPRCSNFGISQSEMKMHIRKQEERLSFKGVRNLYRSGKIPQINEMLVLRCLQPPFDCKMPLI